MTSLENKHNKQKTKGTPDAIDEHVGRQLRRARLLRGFSQEQLAKAVDLTFQQIQKYEHGQNRISAGRLFTFSKILDVPISYFYKNIHGEQTDHDAPSYIDQIISNKDDAQFVRHYISLKKSYPHAVGLLHTLADFLVQREEANLEEASETEQQ